MLAVWGFEVQGAGRFRGLAAGKSSDGLPGVKSQHTGRTGNGSTIPHTPNLTTDLE